jgi:DNA mismatch repair protein MutS
MNDVLKNLLDGRTRSELEYTWNTLFIFEAYVSVSTAIIKNNFCFPTFQQDGIEVDSFFHPLLKSPVKNSLLLSNHIILLTGPNMSGKSTFLKSVGLCVYLGHLGFGVPAKLCKLPFFDSIFVSINLRDDIKNGYSHFMTEITNLKKVLTVAKEKKIFAVFDELFRGTNIDDALEITSKTIAGLSKFVNSYFFISTHLYQLKSFNNNTYQDVIYYYIDCEIKNNIPVFSYKIKEGWSDIKIGRILFEKEGLLNLLE